MFKRGQQSKNSKWRMKYENKAAVNPYLPSWEYVPDAEPHIVDGRVYIYGSHDLFNGLNFCLGDYVCWSAPVDDLGNWRYEGVIFKREQDPARRRSVLQMVWQHRNDPGIGREVLLYYFMGRLQDDLCGCL